MFMSGDDVLSQLEYTRYFDLTKQPLPESRSRIFERLASDQLIQRDVGDRWNITNLGAILFANNLSDFGSSIARKAIRFVAYNGQNRADTVTNRQDIQSGYATGFQELIDYINVILPRNEYIEAVFRRARPLYPFIAIRELIANALIHQDMTITGAGPQVEMFSDRLEITNPGRPLVAPDRFLDLPPRSRNQALASLMRRMDMCEELGTGIDKVVAEVELHQLPPPDFRVASAVEGEAVRVVLFAPRDFSEMTSGETIRACYQHATLKYVGGGRMTNATLRTRLGINVVRASEIIRKTRDAGLIRPADHAHPRRGYVPAWA